MRSAYQRHAASLGRRTAALLACWLAASVSYAQPDELPNRLEPLAGLTSSGQPSAEALAAIAEAGYAAVIDLRAESEDRGFDEPATVEGLGMRYLNLPIADSSEVSYANASALDSLLTDIDGPVLVHCGSGNRVGALLSLRAKLNGADDEAALELGLAGGLTSLRPVVEAKLAEGED